MARGDELNKTGKISFMGANNVSDPGEIPDGFLVSADNVDISDSRVMTLRDELRRVSAHPTHSLYSCEGNLYCVQYKQLCVLDSAFVATPIHSLKSNQMMSYTNLPNGLTLYSNGTDIGYIVAGQRFPIGVPPTEELISLTNTTIKTGLISLPPGDFVEYFSGRVYSAVQDDDNDGCLIAYTDAFSDAVSELENFLYAFGAPTMLMSTDDTLWFSNGRSITAYNSPELETEVPTASYGAVPYTAVSFDASKAGIDGVTGKVILTMTTQGICILSNGGKLTNISKDVYSVPQASIGAAGIVESKGFKRYIAFLSGSTTPYDSF